MVVEQYDELTVDDAKTLVREGDIDAQRLLSHELEHKDRVTLTRWLERRVDEEEEEADDEPAQVRVAAQRGGSIAGIQFDRPHETRVVDRTARVEEAIDKGDLRTLTYE